MINAKIALKKSVEIYNAEALEAHDIAMDKVTEKEYEDPFKGSK